MVSASTAHTLHTHLTDLFSSGACGDPRKQLLGLEVEHFVVALDGTPLHYEATSGGIGACDVLEHLSAAFPQRSYNKDGNLLGLRGPTGTVTLEAGSQLEFSAIPYARVAEFEKAYAEFRSLVDPYLVDHGYRIETWGYHPTRRAQDLGITPQERYAYMDAHFRRNKCSGINTMRATAATQVSVDYTCEKDAVRKLRVASAIAPVLAAIADNSPVFEGRPNHTPLRRMVLWRNVEGRRGGTAPRLFSQGYGFGSYADWLMGTSPIFRPATARKPSEACTQAATQAFPRKDACQKDAEHMASIVWPDARLKRVVEIRPADCMPVDCVLGYAALIKGLLYNERSLAAIEQCLNVVDDRWVLSPAMVNDAIAQIQEHGGEGLVYGLTLYEWEELLFSLARLALDAGDRHYLAPLEAFAADKHWWHVS